MKITGLTPIVVNAQMRHWIFVKFETDQGSSGGEKRRSPGDGGSSRSSARPRPVRCGGEPQRIEPLPDHFAAGSSRCQRSPGSRWPAGIFSGRPIYQLLGGQIHERVRMSGHLGGGEMKSLYLDDTAEAMAERARQSAEAATARSTSSSCRAWRRWTETGCCIMPSA